MPILLDHYSFRDYHHFAENLLDFIKNFRLDETSSDSYLGVEITVDSKGTSVRSDSLIGLVDIHQILL